MRKLKCRFGFHKYVITDVEKNHNREPWEVITTVFNRIYTHQCKRCAKVTKGKMLLV